MSKDLGLTLLNLCIKVCEYFSGTRLGLFTEGYTSLSGEEVDRVDVGYLRSIINKVAVFYRVTPRNKLKIVKVSCIWIDFQKLVRTSNH